MQHESAAPSASRDPYAGIFKLMDVYFNGIYTGDATTLRSTFHPRCRLFAEVNGEPYEKSVDEYMDGVANRKSPECLGEPFSMEAIGVEILGNIALVRTRQQMLGFNYFDYLTLVRRGELWQIVNKTFTNVNPAQSPANAKR
jgi:hypothetical protein